MTATIDKAGPVRSGEELDSQAIARFLAANGAVFGGLPAVTQFSGGASNLTYQLDFPGRSLILRRPPFGHKARSAHDMIREARIMTALRDVYPRVPGVVAVCEDPGVIGCDFFVMERIDGVILRRDLPEGMTLDAERARALCRAMLDALIDLHEVDWQVAGLRELGRGEGYVARQLEGWRDRFDKARTPDVAACDDVIRWLSGHAPARDAATCLIHNDWRFDNLVLDRNDPSRIIGVLDWEMATLGDPLMDLGNALAYWVEAGDDATFRAVRRQPTHLPGMLSRREVIEYYGAKTGRDMSDFVFYDVFGIFRLAVIVQQIWRRYYQGETRNPQFAQFGALVNYLLDRCRRVIKEN
ncbi:phosphotransferase family protein [Paludibacterium paludis]|uniref:Phosphotransferase n=1 Tax=Paludibacterium paludis TaxID=1225769 RepID=A0A918U6I5_9NEIS|nr:phosphotransferase family protein [Paludibacterium paludis]GGY03059.1 phosphotransferase [Paludibacterium paludis]